MKYLLLKLVFYNIYFKFVNLSMRQREVKNFSRKTD